LEVLGRAGLVAGAQGPGAEPVKREGFGSRVKYLAPVPGDQFPLDRERPPKRCLGRGGLAGADEELPLHREGGGEFGPEEQVLGVGPGQFLAEFYRPGVAVSGCREVARAKVGLGDPQERACQVLTVAGVPGILAGEVLADGEGFAKTLASPGNVAESVPRGADAGVSFTEVGEDVIARLNPVPVLVAVRVLQDRLAKGERFLVVLEGPDRVAIDLQGHFGQYLEGGGEV